MVRLFTYCSYLILFALVTSCGIPSLQDPKKKKLVIASDFLDYRDRSLFKSYSKEFNTEVHIIHMPADSIQSKLKKEGYTTRIDVIMLRSSMDFCDFSKNGLLQSLNDPEECPDLPYRYKGKKNQWFGLGADPYIIVQKQDSLRKIVNYTDLSKTTSWTTDLKDNADLTALFVPLLHKYRENRNVLRKMSTAIFDREIEYTRPGDSAFYFPPLLTRYSDFYSDSTLYRSGYKRARIIFPGQTKGGVHFELRAAGIVRQARNYTAAVEFLTYFTEPRNNEKLNNWWNTFPLTRSMERAFTYQNKRFKSYPVASDELCAYREEAIRMVSKNRRK